MRLILGISVIISTFLSHGEAATCDRLPDLYVCRESGMLSHMTADFGSNVEMDVREGIASNAFEGLDIKELNISSSYRPVDSRHMFSLQPDSFSGLYLQSLHFTYVELSNEAEPLLPIAGLRHLHLVGNGLTEVPSDLFSNQHLETLEISENSIRVIRANVFAALTNLYQLTLSNNGITTLQPGCFNGLENLRRLILKSNNITLRPGIFDSLKYLHALEFKDNGQFDTQAFRGLPKLTELTITTHQEITLEPGMFDDSPNLSWINLEYNQIRHIPKDVFNNLRTRPRINLQENAIESIEPGAFQNLTSLDLRSGFKGRIIPTGTFKNLTVESLWLLANGLVEIRPRAFEGLKADLLDLWNNNITKIGPEAFAGVDLRELLLSKNPIKEVAPDAFKGAKIEKTTVRRNSILLGDKSLLGIPDSVNIELENKHFGTKNFRAALFFGDAWFPSGSEENL